MLWLLFWLNPFSWIWWLIVVWAIYELA